MKTFTLLPIFLFFRWLISSNIGLPRKHINSKHHFPAMIESAYISDLELKMLLSTIRDLCLAMITLSFWKSLSYVKKYSQKPTKKKINYLLLARTINLKHRKLSGDSKCIPTWHLKYIMTLFSSIAIILNHWMLTEPRMKAPRYWLILLPSCPCRFLVVSNGAAAEITRKFSVCKPMLTCKIEEWWKKEASWFYPNSNGSVHIATPFLAILSSTSSSSSK